jgi:hypothetical protein
MDALSRSGDVRAAESIAALMSRPEVVLRRKAVEVLGELGGDRARAALIAALGDEDALVRGLAAWGLGKIGGPGVAPALVEALDDHGWSVAIDAAGALARLADPETGEALCQALDDTRGIVHLEANLLLAAAATGAPCALPRSITAFRTSQVPVVRSAAARAIGMAIDRADTSLPSGAAAPAPAAGAGSPDDAAPPDAAGETARGRAILGACVSEDQSPQVQAVCRGALERPAQPPPRDDWIEFFLYSSDGSELRPRARYLLVLPDGFTKAGVTDSNAFAREAPVRSGEFSVLDPAAIQRSQP